MKIIALLAATILVTGCAQKAGWHKEQVDSSENQTFSVGEVQRNIKKGMSSAAVAESLGSPNIVSTDENGREVWIYDRFSSEQVVSASNGLTFSLSEIGAGAVKKSQKTITVIIKYDNNNRVRDFAYHTSRF